MLQCLLSGVDEKDIVGLFRARHDGRQNIPVVFTQVMNALQTGYSGCRWQRIFIKAERT